MSPLLFKDRFAAAKLLAEELIQYKNRKNAIVLAIPRGGLQTGYVLAKELHLPLDIILTKKIGHPFSSETAIGAVSLTTEFIEPEFQLGREAAGGISADYIKSQVQEIRKKLQERYKLYRGTTPSPKLKDKIVIIVDDGIATGSTMLAAVDLVKKEQPQKVIVAVPIGSEDTVTRLRQKADKVVCLRMPLDFYAIGQFYEQFPQVEDEEAIKLLHDADKTQKWFAEKVRNPA